MAMTLVAAGRKNRPPRRWVPLAVVTVLGVGALGVALGRGLDPTRRPGTVPFCDPSLPAAAVGTPVPAFAAVDQDGKQVSGNDFHGLPWISDFIFTSCTASCPILTGRLVALQRALAGLPVRFVSFSVDPEHDTPPVMKAYADRWHGDPARWRLLATDRDTLARLGGALGGAEDPSASGPFHSDRFALVDGTGHLLGLYASSSATDLDRLRRDLRAALPRTHEAPADRTTSRPTGATSL